METLFDQPRLRCDLCDHKIPGMTGLQELQNMVAHLQEHHHGYDGMDMIQAAALRAEWEEKQYGG